MIISQLSSIVAKNADARRVAKMKINEVVIQEGASMTGYMRDTVSFNGEPREVWTFPKGYEKDTEVQSRYFSNASMREVLDTLGMDSDFENAGPVPIDQFINLSTQWLQKHVGKTSAEEPDTVTQEPGSARMIDGGKPEGYFNQAIMHLNQTARRIKEKYTQLTHVSFN